MRLDHCPARFAASSVASPPFHPFVVADAPVATDTPWTAATRGAFTFDLALRHAGTRRVQLRWEALGAATLPVVLVAGGISADRHVAASAAFPDPGWWQAQVGAERALDPARQRILAIDWLGADGGIDAPIDPTDQADAIAAVLDSLDIGRLEAFVGCSYGALVGLQFAARHGQRLRRLVAISGTHRAHPFASAWRALQRQAVALGALQGDEGHGLALARQLAMLSYRTAAEFDERFTGVEVVNGRVRVAAEDYLDHCGAMYAARTPPTAFLRLSESIDLQSLDPGQVRMPTTVVAVAEDQLFPLADACHLVERLAGTSRLRVLHSRYGHDAFLKEPAAIAAVLVEGLAYAVADDAQVTA